MYAYALGYNQYNRYINVKHVVCHDYHGIPITNNLYKMILHCQVQMSVVLMGMVKPLSILPTHDCECYTPTTH